MSVPCNKPVKLTGLNKFKPSKSSGLGNLVGEIVNYLNPKKNKIKPKNASIGIRG